MDLDSTTTNGGMDPGVDEHRSNQTGDHAHGERQLEGAAYAEGRVPTCGGLELIA